MTARYFLNSIILMAGTIIFTQCTPKYGAHFQRIPFDNDQTKKYVTESTGNNVSQPLKVESEFNKANDISQIQPIPHSTMSTAPDLSSSFKRIENSQPLFHPEMSRKELRVKRKELKREIRELKDQENISNQKIWIGIIVASAGILVSILVSGSGASLGAVAIIVGIGLIAWGLIEEGGIH